LSGTEEGEVQVDLVDGNMILANFIEGALSGVVVYGATISHRVGERGQDRALINGR
jgi:hypothetical protein